MAMTPEERTEFDEMKRKLDSIARVEDVPFIENIKRRGGQGLRSDGTGTLSTIVKSVSEGGAASYDVCDAPDAKLKIVTASGTVYYLPAFTS